MAEEEKKENPIPEDAQDEAGTVPESEAPGTEEAPGTQEPQPSPAEEKPKKDQGQLLAEAAEKYLRLAAEYDNYRKRTAKEKENAWAGAKGPAGCRRPLPSARVPGLSCRSSE